MPTRAAAVRREGHAPPVRRLDSAILEPMLAWLLPLLVLTGCASPPPPAPNPGVDGYDETRLQVLVHSGLRTMALGPCRAALFLGVLDDDESGMQLDRLLARTSGPNADVACSETIAAARIVRLGRLGLLDLEAEVQGPSPIARAVALRYALGTQTPAVAKDLIWLATADADLDVRIVAYRAAIALGDAELLEALAELTPVNETEEFWRCIALTGLRPSDTCPEPSRVRAALPPGDAEPASRCDQARADIETRDRRDALWFHLEAAFRQRVDPLDRIDLPRRSEAPCLLDEDTAEGVLGSAVPQDQAIVAADLLWRRHEPLGMTREKRVQLREFVTDDTMRYCSSSGDCPAASDCFRPPGHGRRGVCGSPRSSREDNRPRVYIMVGSNACWSFMDCPAFYSCYYPDRTSPYGVCVY